MANMDSAPTKFITVLKDPRSSLNSELMNEVFAMKCSNASRPSSGVQNGLRRRLRNRPMEYAVVSDDAQEKCCLLGDRVGTTSNGDKKTPDGFAKCMGKYLSACRSNVNNVLRRKPRRPQNSTKLVTPPQNTQMDLDGEDHSNVPCLGRGCWRALREKLGPIIKIEEEIFISVPRSILYYA